MGSGLVPEVRRLPLGSHVVLGGGAVVLEVPVSVLGWFWVGMKILVQLPGWFWWFQRFSCGSRGGRKNIKKVHSQKFSKLKL
jgi:hypothetical protein